LWIGFVEADDTDGTGEKQKLDEATGWPVLVLGRRIDGVVSSSLYFSHGGQYVLEDEESNLQASTLPREVD
jgi:hypothetical protein